MPRYLILLFYILSHLSLFGTVLNAQDTTNHAIQNILLKKAIKVNLNVFYDHDAGDWRIQSPTLSVLLNVHKRFIHEVECSSLKSTDYIDTTLFSYQVKFRNLTFGLRHQVTYNLFREKKRRPDLQVGLSVNYNIQRSKISPLDQLHPTRKVFMVRPTLAVVFQVSQQINHRLFYTISVPFEFVDLVMYRQKVEGEPIAGGVETNAFFLKTFHGIFSLGFRL